MRARIIAGPMLAALSFAAPLSAQSVAADVVLRSGPIAGHISVGDNYSSYYHPPARRVVVVERVAPRVIVVERFHSRRHFKHWKRHGYRPVTVYHINGRYYDRYDRRHSRARQIVIYERGGRYYRDWDDRHDRWDDDRDDHRRDDDHRDRYRRR